MTREIFNTGWAIRPWASIFAQLGSAGPAPRPVTLPHDAVLELERTTTAAPEQAYYPGGAFTYTRALAVPDEWKNRRVSIHFEGVYRDAMVYVNGAFAAQRPYGYSGFTVPLDPYLRYGQENELRVDARVHQDARWYSGGGIYRDVHLIVTDLVHFADAGVRIVTKSVAEDLAVIEVTAAVSNETPHTALTRIDIVAVDPTGVVVGQGGAPVTVQAGGTETSRIRLYLDAPALWSVDEPQQYRIEARLTHEDAVVDEQTHDFGVRSIQVDPTHGLRINGRTVKLRGSCLHHDNGILGAASFGRAEERRIELLKAAGFNAIRSSHYPASPSLLDACDRLGMLVIDETFDMWAQSKSPFDYSLAFDDWWERDVDAMVAKDANHASVIMYSIGNEIPETGDPLGSLIGRRIAERFRASDPSRLVTNGINGIVSTLEEVLAAEAVATAAGVNHILGDSTGVANPMNAAPFVTARTEESFSVLDVAGMNYGESRYELDQTLFPDRIIVGSETFPNQMVRSWGLVERLPHVIGDFTWTGFDYLGEVGLGRPIFEGDPASFLGAFPWTTAWCGDLDLTGYRRPASYLREIVFGLADGPHIAVTRPTTRARSAETTQWAWSDTETSWTWNVDHGTLLDVEVYAAADEVELLLDGHSLGRRPTGRAAGYIARYSVPFSPGTLEAVALTGDQEVGRHRLQSAVGAPKLKVAADRTRLHADHADLAFVTIELCDENGTLYTSHDRTVTVAVEGPGALLGLGSARPVNSEGYLSDSHSTFEGRALAVVRPLAAGSIRITVDGGDGLSQTIELVVD